MSMQATSWRADVVAAAALAIACLVVPTSLCAQGSPPAPASDRTRVEAAKKAGQQCKEYDRAWTDRQLLDTLAACRAAFAKWTDILEKTRNPNLKGAAGRGVIAVARAWGLSEAQHAVRIYQTGNKDARRHLALGCHLMDMATAGDSEKDKQKKGSPTVLLKTIDLMAEKGFSKSCKELAAESPSLLQR